jgi:hypothetical protein
MTVSTAAADLLVPTGGAFREAGMDDRTDVGLIDTKPKGGRRNNDIDFAVGPSSYHFLPFCCLRIAREEGEASVAASV